ncbi:crossover junction endonuclease MUS81 [Spea bombifrons]|uniref:crossover junction endonuclease MUS81 n=1 Tax=Spea bombifrons TaxID=233779 RepID=UPI00234BF6FD|nr:crossover junction endonuclease MUS81 [Spea bombifrons]
MPGQVTFGRKRPLPPCPNPLFLKWLTEWRDAAAEKGLKTQFVYQKAISSLKKYPLPLRNGKEAKILQNFGDGICKMLDQRLEKHYAEHGPDASIHSLPGSSSTSARGREQQRASSPIPTTSGLEAPQTESHQQGPSPSKKKKTEGKKQREYVPQKRSGGFAVLVTLYKNSKSPGSKGYMTKAELQREAQPLCDKSFTLTDPSSKYTAWSSVSMLIQKDLVIKTHSPARYSLTEKGSELARKLAAAEQGPEYSDKSNVVTSHDEEELEKESMDQEKDVQNIRVLPVQSHHYQPLSVSSLKIMQEPSGTHASSSYQHVPDFTLRPGQFDIILCVDFIETTGGAAHRKQDLVSELKKNGVNFDVRKLHIGDFVWIAQEKVQPLPGQLRMPQARELVLDYVVERKRMDDLCGSIIDGRFREQKFRLKRCGLCRPIYLVEDHGSAQHLSIPETTLQQAIVNTQVVDGFFIKRTKDVRESAAYLTLMTRYLHGMYSSKILLSCTKEDNDKFQRELPSRNAQSCILLDFKEFNEGAMKNKAQTVKEVFARQLMQISGVSGEKAAAVLDRYGTPASLMSAYERCNSNEEKEKMLSNVKCGKLQRNLGPVMSKTICQLYCTKGSLS